MLSIYNLFINEGAGWALTKLVGGTGLAAEQIGSSAGHMADLGGMVGKPVYNVAKQVVGSPIQTAKYAIPGAIGITALGARQRGKIKEATDKMI